MIPASTLKLFVGFFAFEINPELSAKFPNMLRSSQNENADKILEGSGGIPALMEFFQSRGVPVTDELAMFDGSGLSMENRSTANLQVALLEHIRSTEKYQSFKRQLAQPRQYGTLKKRMAEMRGSLFAKTGSMPIMGEAALAGYMETMNGTIVFSILGNDVRCPTIYWARQAIDKAVWLHGRYIGFVAARVPNKRKAPPLNRNRAFRQLQQANVFEASK